MCRETDVKTVSSMKELEFSPLGSRQPLKMCSRNVIGSDSPAHSDVSVEGCLEGVLRLESGDTSSTISSANYPAPRLVSGWSELCF